MKTFILLILFSLTFSICQADYESTTLPELIEKSDLIVEGKIVKIDKETVELLIIEVIKGDTALKNITVQKFNDWTCASRWTTYQIGQTELVFLLKDQNMNLWHSMGAGNEGEMPIENETLFYKSLYMKIDESPEFLKVNDGEIYGYKFHLQDAKSAIKELRMNIDHINKMIEQNKLAEFKTENQFMRRILDELNEIKN